MRVVFRSRWRPPAGVRGQSCRSVHSPAATAGPGACRTDHAPHVGWRPWPTGIASGGDRCWRSLACLSSSRSSSPFCLRRRLWLHARRFRRPLAPGPHLERVLVPATPHRPAGGSWRRARMGDTTAVWTGAPVSGAGATTRARATASTQASQSTLTEAASCPISGRMSTGWGTTGRRPTRSSFTARPGSPKGRLS